MTISRLVPEVPPEDVVEEFKKKVRNHNKNRCKPPGAVDGFRAGWQAAVAAITSEGPDSEPCRDARVLVQVALMLEDDLVGTVALLLRSLRGHTYAAIGSKFALSRQAIHQRITTLAHRYPGVAGILTEKKEQT